MKRVKPAEVILAALPGTKMQLAERAGLHRATAIRTINKLHAAGQLHICRWIRHPVRGPSIPFYASGPGDDVPDTLPRLTRKEISARYEKRVKGTDKYFERRARQRSRWWEMKAKAEPQHPFSALFVGRGAP